MTATGWSHTALAKETVFGVAILLGLICYGTIQHPASVTQGGDLILTTAVGFLIAYGAAALWNRRHGSGAMSIALMIGAALGLIVGAVEMVNISLETSGSVNQTIRGIAPPTAMALMALLFGTAGSMAYQRTSSFRLAVWSGIWCALIGTILTCIFGFAYSVGFMPYMEQINHVEYLRSGMQDPSAFVIRKTLHDMSSHLVIAPLMAAFFSCSGALISAYLEPAECRVVITFAFFGVLQLALGVGAIRWASSLARPQRPPFIMIGMLASGIALTYVYAVFSALALRRTSK